jgi:hypothetical protein
VPQDAGSLSALSSRARLLGLPLRSWFGGGPVGLPHAAVLTGRYIKSPPGSAQEVRTTSAITTKNPRAGGSLV